MKEQSLEEKAKQAQSELYTKDEVIRLLVAAKNDIFKEDTSLEQWIEQNLKK